MKWADSYALALTVFHPNWCTPLLRWNPPGNRMQFRDKGAAGLMQLMPHTAAQFGVTNRFAPEENIHGGVAYLARLFQIFTVISA